MLLRKFVSLGEEEEEEEEGNWLRHAYLGRVGSSQQGKK